jgi:hypothetical protein
LWFFVKTLCSLWLMYFMIIPRQSEPLVYSIIS